MHEYPTVLDTIFDEPISNSEILLCVFTNLVSDVDVEILKVFVTFCILLARGVQDVSNTFFNQVCCFEG